MSYHFRKLLTARLQGLRGCSQMTPAFFGVSDNSWCLCQSIISFWHAPWCFKLTTSFVNSPEPKTIKPKPKLLITIYKYIFVVVVRKMPIQPSFCPKGVQLNLVRPTKTRFVSFRQLFKLPLVFQCCNVICEWPLTASPSQNLNQ